MSMLMPLSSGDRPLPGFRASASPGRVSRTTITVQCVLSSLEPNPHVFLTTMKVRDRRQRPEEANTSRHGDNGQDWQQTVCRHGKKTEMAKFIQDFMTCRPVATRTAAQISSISGGRPKYRANQAGNERSLQVSIASAPHELHALVGARAHSSVVGGATRSEKPFKRLRAARVQRSEDSRARRRRTSATVGEQQIV
jgi:hypothetical protein